MWFSDIWDMIWHDNDHDSITNLGLSKRYGSIHDWIYDMIRFMI